MVKTQDHLVTMLAHDFMLHSTKADGWHMCSDILLDGVASHTEYP